MKTLSEIAAMLKSKNFIYILTHMYPDGDTLGSAYALCRAFQKMGKKAKVLCTGEVSDKFKFMSEYVEQEDFEPEFIMSVDIAALKLVGENLNDYKESISLCIDHHISNENYAEITFVDPMAAANAEIIYRLILEMGIEIDSEMAECLYTGIATDTGCFKYSNVTSQTHVIAADLITKNLDLEELNTRLFVTKSKKMLSLEKMIYDNLEYHFDDKCALIYVTKDMMKKCDISDGNLEGISSIPKSIDGVKVGITMREKENNSYKISVRTLGDINAMKFCKPFGGGGHIHAAGCEIRGTLEEVKNRFLNNVKEQLRW